MFICARVKRSKKTATSTGGAMARQTIIEKASGSSGKSLGQPCTVEMHKQNHAECMCEAEKSANDMISQ